MENLDNFMMDSNEDQWGPPQNPIPIYTQEENEMLELLLTQSPKLAQASTVDRSSSNLSHTNLPSSSSIPPFLSSSYDPHTSYDISAPLYNFSGPNQSLSSLLSTTPSAYSDTSGISFPSFQNVPPGDANLPGISASNAGIGWTAFRDFTDSRDGILGGIVASVTMETGGGTRIETAAEFVQEMQDLDFLNAEGQSTVNQAGFLALNPRFARLFYYMKVVALVLSIANFAVPLAPSTDPFASPFMPYAQTAIKKVMEAHKRSPVPNLGPLSEREERK